MTRDEALLSVERPWRGVMHGVSVLVVGGADDGDLGIRLARHSARVCVLTESEADRERIDAKRPQALDMRVLCVEDVGEWLSGYAGRSFDVKLSVESAESYKYYEGE